jgi:hypothetical protein
MRSWAGALRRTTLAAAAGAALVALGAPCAVGAPETDARGFVDSTARCEAPDEAVVYGSTESSRVAICKTPDDKYQYRGVRISDGAKLILPASRSGGVIWVAQEGATTYSVSSRSLVVSKGGNVIRREAMIDYHPSDASEAPPPQAPEGPPAQPETAPPGQPEDSPPAPETPRTQETPLPPPLPAEVGGG